MRQRDARSALQGDAISSGGQLSGHYHVSERTKLQGDAISSGGQLPVPPALCPHGGDTQIPTLPLYV